MRIYVYYEDKNDRTYIEVPDDECTVMIQRDQEARQTEAEEGETVEPRSVQEIMDEEFNKPTFNRNQAETRRHVHLEALDPEDKHLANGTDILKEIIEREGYEALHAAIGRLQPQQRELLYRVYWNGEKQKDIAAEDGVSERAITGRMKKIYAALKKILS